MTTRYRLLSAILLSGALCLRMASHALEIGDPAPPVSLGAWIQPGPVDLLAGSQPQGSRFFLIDFWATWCAPCRNMMPHLTEVQARYADQGLVVLAISTEQAGVATNFVRASPGLMGYAVAVDDAGKTHRAYMEAVRAPGIPYAFLIDRDGRLAWHGIPSASTVEDVVRKVARGVYDPAAERRAARAERLIPRYLSLVRTNEGAGAAREIGEQIVNDLAVNPAALNAFAWSILTDASVRERDTELALRAARAADEATDGLEPMILETLARALFDSGDVAGAIDAQTRAVEHCSERLLRPQFERTLDEYRSHAATSTENE